MLTDDTEHQAILEASCWLGRMQSREFSHADHHAWALWHSAKPEHQRAWRLVADVRRHVSMAHASTRQPQPRQPLRLGLHMLYALLWTLIGPGY
ncbi:DUF4880 domain-containing protein [Dyella sp. C9]|uniref:FecR/PupR family sigma factor regulator n=1 Tax=Dyella sp. C9 TaxID=2202154 RepID=UPI0013009AD4|nr:DUF4880 domain-containing protein [Dyella sp. C9]